MSQKNQQLLGVVLCGGESRRMGSDKGLLQVAGKSWACLAGERLSAELLPVVFSVRTAQYRTYTEQVCQAVCIPDSLEIPGPLNGLLSVHRRCPDRDLLVVACDMVFLNAHTLRPLIHQYRSGRAADCYAYRIGGQTEPFCAIYTADLLRRWMEKFRAGMLTRYHLKQLSDEGNTSWLEAEQPQAFFNANRPEDQLIVLESLRKAS